MRTVHEVSELSGVSVKTLHYYDKIGLLHPAQVTKAGYRLYDDANLDRLQLILLFRELKFPLKDIALILDSSTGDRNQLLDQQITLLKLQKEHIEDLIDLACEIKRIGVKKLDFSAFNTKKIDEYAAQAKATWGKTEAYREFEKKNEGRTIEEEKVLSLEIMEIFEKFGQMRELDPKEERVQQQVAKLRQFITDHYYTCTKEILSSLGMMYSGGGSMTENIDKMGGDGTAEFADQAIQIYCQR